MKPLELTGLKAHHPLGFLAACGLFRCLAQIAQDASVGRKSVVFDRVKLGWHLDDGKETVAVIYGEHPIDIPAIARRVPCMATEQRCSPAWTWSTRIDDRTKYREKSQAAVERFHSSAIRDDVDMFAALASDLTTTEEDKLQKTAFDLTSGQQRLLESFKNIAKGVEQNAKSQFEEVLKGPWRYQDKDHSLGWDPQTQRLHALRGKAPGNDEENRSVRAAVFLASLTLPMFPCFAVGGGLRTTGFHRHDNDEWFAWPVWREPISLATLRSLLSHPFNGDLRQRGVDVIYRCRVARTGGSQGKYQVFGHPEERLWPRSADDQV